MKIICPNCNEIIEVNEEEVTSCACPKCKMKFPVIEGKKAYESTFQLLKNRGHKAYLKFNFEEAQEYYLEALSLKGDDLDAISKYSLNLLYSSRFDDLKFKSVVEFLDSKEIILNGDNTYTFLGFLETFISQIFVFLKESKRLKVEDTFIKEEYFNYYYKGLKDIKYSLDYFKNVFSLLKKEEYDHFVEGSDTNINDYFAKAEKEINSRLLRTYNINHKGDVTVEDDKLVYDGTNIKDVIDIEIKDLRVIVPNEKVQKLMKLMYVGSGTSLGLALILIILGLVLKISLLTYLSFIPLGIAIIILGYAVINARKENNKQD